MPGFDRPVAPDPYSLLPAVPSFALTSDDLTDGGVVPQAQVHRGPGGDNISPQLSWSGAPAETQGYLVTCFDPDAPTGCGWWHWVLAGIPADVTSLPTGIGDEESTLLPAGAFQLVNDFGDAAFGGAGAPVGDRAHRYIFAVNALDTPELDLDATDGSPYAAFVTVQHTIARAVLTATWQNPS